MFQKIVVGYDGSTSAETALQCAIALTKKFEAQLTALWVCEPLPRHAEIEENDSAEAMERIDEYFKARCAEVKAIADQHGLVISCERLWGDTADAVVRFADVGRFDLIVIGHSNHSELWGRLLGDTADRIADNAHCHVLIAKGLEHLEKPY